MTIDNYLLEALRRMERAGQISQSTDYRGRALWPSWFPPDRKDDVLLRATYLAFNIMKEEVVGMLKVISEQTRPLRDQDDPRFPVLLDALREKNFEVALQIIEDLKARP